MSIDIYIDIDMVSALPECQFGACIDLIDVVVARMIEIVANAGYEQYEAFQIAQTSQ